MLRNKLIWKNSPKGSSSLESSLNNGIFFFSSWVVMPQEFLSAPPPALSWVQQNLLLPLPLRIKVYELWAWAFLREVPQLLAHVAALLLLSSDLFFFVDGSSIHWPLGTSILVTVWSNFLLVHLPRHSQSHSWALASTPSLGPSPL